MFSGSLRSREEPGKVFHFSDEIEIVFLQVRGARPRKAHRPVFSDAIPD